MKRLKNEQQMFLQELADLKTKAIIQSQVEKEEIYLEAEEAKQNKASTESLT